MYERMSDGAFTEPYRFELRADGTCRWRTSSLPETWSECLYSLEIASSPPRFRMTAPDGTLLVEWEVVRRDGDALRMYPPGRDWEERDYGRTRALTVTGAPAQYVWVGALEDGAENVAASWIPVGFELSMRAGDRLVLSDLSADRWVFGPVIVADPGPLLRPANAAGFACRAGAGRRYLLVTRGSVQPHLFDASGRAYRFLFDRGYDIDLTYETTGAAIGDVTGDGRADVLIASGTYMASLAQRCSIFVYDQRPDRTLTDTPRQLPYASDCYGSEAEDIEIHDLDRAGWCVCSQTGNLARSRQRNAQAVLRSLGRVQRYVASDGRDARRRGWRRRRW
jgi:hypothetical protein